MPAEPAPPFTFIDLFAGIGGMRLGFESAGGQCVFSSEWDRFARKTYAANFGESEDEIAGDLREVPAIDIPRHELLVAGFPCQPFSIAGVSKKRSLGRPDGFADKTQGTLFFEIARILDLHRPAAFLLENVKNLASHDRGRTFKVILETLREELGYHVSWRVIDAKAFVPQHRERIFILGTLAADGPRLDDLELPPVSSGPRLSSILHPEDGSESKEERFTKGRKAKVIDKYVLSAKLWRYLQDYAEKHRRKGNGFGFGLVGPDDVARTLSARYYKDGSEILIKRGRGRPRRLTPRECARLMGFEGPVLAETGRESWQIPVSDTQAYKQFGNAVAVPVIATIARFLAPFLEERARRRERAPLLLPGLKAS